MTSTFMTRMCVLNDRAVQGLRSGNADVRHIRHGDVVLSAARHHDRYVCADRPRPAAATSRTTPHDGDKLGEIRITTTR
jgi:hypothetical protein